MICRAWMNKDRTRVTAATFIEHEGGQIDRVIQSSEWSLDAGWRGNSTVPISVLDHILRGVRLGTIGDAA